MNDRERRIAFREIEHIMSDFGLKEIQNDLLCNIDEEYEGDSDRLEEDAQGAKKKRSMRFGQNSQKKIGNDNI